MIVAIQHQKDWFLRGSLLYGLPSFTVSIISVSEVSALFQYLHLGLDHK